jgi:putative NADH-flavin reductase
LLARHPDAVRAAGERVTVIAGDVLDPAAVAETVAGADAVVSVFGLVKGSPEDLQTRGTRNLVDAMRKQGVSRVITLTGGGLRDRQDQPKLADKVIQGALKLMAGHVLKDAEGHLRVLEASGLEWTVVRAPRLTTKPGTGHYRLGWVDGSSGTQVSRDDLADAILAQLHDTGYVHAMPFVSA